MICLNNAAVQYFIMSWLWQKLFLFIMILYRDSAVTMEIIYFAANVLCNPHVAKVSPCTTKHWFPAKKWTVHLL